MCDMYETLHNTARDAQDLSHRSMQELTVFHFFSQHEAIYQCTNLGKYKVIPICK